MMTLKQVRNDIKDSIDIHGVAETFYLELWLTAIDAHIAQQPDLAAIREVIAKLRAADEALCDEPCGGWADKLACAIRDKP